MLRLDAMNRQRLAVIRPRFRFSTSSPSSSAPNPGAAKAEKAAKASGSGGGTQLVTWKTLFGFGACAASLMLAYRYAKIRSEAGKTAGNNGLLHRRYRYSHSRPFRQ
jgi:hypothetical protein